MVGIKTTGEQISILCHNGTIFDKPREKMNWPSKDTSTSTLVIRKESSDSSHECIILDIIHHVLIKNICTCAV
jgi:hypothetical protein